MDKEKLRREIQIGSIVHVVCQFPNADNPQKFKFAVVVCMDPFLVVLLNTHMTAFQEDRPHVRECIVHVEPGQRHFPPKFKEKPNGSYVNCYEPHQQWIDSGLDGFLNGMAVKGSRHVGPVSAEVLGRIRAAIAESMGIQPVLQQAIEHELAAILGPPP